MNPGVTISMTLEFSNIFYDPFDRWNERNDLGVNSRYQQFLGQSSDLILVLLIIDNSEHEEFCVKK